VVGVRVVLDLAAEIDEVRVRLGMDPLEAIDIGGGLPPDDDCSLVVRYAALLRSRCPELFDGGRRVLTEFGRYYHAGAGVTLSRVAQVKAHARGQTILHHVGADLFVRASYQAAGPPELELQDADGAPRTGPLLSTNVAGPLCFAGDHLATGVSLPRAKVGDWLHIRDTGANTLALWSHHCSRPRPAVITWDSSDPAAAPRIVLPRQEPEEAIALWDAPAHRP
jgi:diaminopimelate decarboxylase